MEREISKIVSGIVVKKNSPKTITVELQKLVKHPRYGKYIRKTSSYKVHDEKNEVQLGDKVQITECRPLSKTKRWRLVEIVGKATGSP
ncbi:MAG: 30S ribosomal protein S17 [Planctomycetota bacterium]